MNYLRQDEYRACDPGLWLGLKAIVDGGTREVRRMENDDILHATFFSDCLDFRRKKKAKRTERQAEWFAKSLETMGGNDIVCVDPDNGLVVPSELGPVGECGKVLWLLAGLDSGGHLQLRAQTIVACCFSRKFASRPS